MTREIAENEYELVFTTGFINRFGSDLPKVQEKIVCSMETKVGIRTNHDLLTIVVYQLQ